MIVPKKKTKATESKFRLEDYLILAPFMVKRLGFKRIGELLRTFKEIPEGFGLDGRSHMYYAIIQKDGIDPEIAGKMAIYDENIQKHVECINKKRDPPVVLKYFQYLAALFTEIYLDELFADPDAFQNRLTEFLYERNPIASDAYSQRDMRKLAYWMATGSGKTLLMHLNLLQFKYYNKGSYKIDIENILIIASSEDMSKQHIEELAKSGITARLFQGDIGGYFTTESRDLVKVTDINKLRLPEERRDERGQVVTVDVSELGERNLVFVDEGHKGHKSEDRVWKRRRLALAKNGFTFEYSATFGQVIEEKNQDDLDEYSKTILFDYSYKYFHSDRYGKEFRLVNLKNYSDEHVNTLLLANAISLYEQVRVFNELGQHAKEYGVERPLWMFVGREVKGTSSDIMAIIKFFSWLVQNRTEVEKKIREILDGKSGLPSPDEHDAFAKREPETVFPFLRGHKINPSEVARGIYSEVLYFPEGASASQLHICGIKKGEGELGLKVGGSGKYFGLIYVGKPADVKDAVEKELQQVVVELDAVSEPLFSNVKKPDSPINILIGAKKFIEGWDCWRVSNMGLMDVGQGEGPLIIQLFGRGVRLKGKKWSLKRSDPNDPTRPPFISVLETLGIFGIKANYMVQFKDMINKEDIPLPKLITVPVKQVEPMPKGLLVPILKEGADFLSDDMFTLRDVQDMTGIQPRIDKLPKVEVLDSRPEPSLMMSDGTRNLRIIKKEFLDLLDWDCIYIDALKIRAERQLCNMIFTIDDLKGILYENRYQLLAPKEETEPTEEFERLEKLQDIVRQTIRTYIERGWARRRDKWEKDNTELVSLEKAIQKDALYMPSKYDIRIPDSDQNKTLITTAEKLKDQDSLRQGKGQEPLVNAYYEKHLYQPLLVAQGSHEVIIEPGGLNEGEQDFVEHLAAYLSQPNPIHTKGYDVYLLRNFTRGKGIGFHVGIPFYPDFLMWIVDLQKKCQWILYIDPKGLVFSGGIDSPKLNLFKTLKDKGVLHTEGWEVMQDAFTVSTTPFDRTSAIFHHFPSKLEEYEENYHILFQELAQGNPCQYVKRMFDLMNCT